MEIQIEQTENGVPESYNCVSINVGCKKEEPIAPIEVSPNIEEATIELKQDYDSDDSWANPILEHVRQPKDFLWTVGRTDAIYPNPEAWIQNDIDKLYVSLYC